MRKTRKTEFNLEIEEAVTVRAGRAVLAPCEECRGQVRMVAADEASLMAGLSARELYRLVEAGGLHFFEDRHGLLFVCVASLHRLGRGHPWQRITRAKEE